MIVVLFYLPYHWSDMACGLLFAVAGITDSLDGYLARKLGQISPLGAFLDPVADKLIVAMALVLLVSKEPGLVRRRSRPPSSSAAKSPSRRCANGWRRSAHAHKVAVSGVGKFKTILQMIGLSMMLFRRTCSACRSTSIGLAPAVVAAVLTLWSMIAYLRAAWPELSGTSSRANLDTPDPDS